LEPIPEALFADLFLDLLDATEFHACGALRFFCRHARAKVVFGQHREVGMNFLVEIALHLPRQEEIPQESFCFKEEWHAKHSVTA
jgi:hypothetical protein